MACSLHPTGWCDCEAQARVQQDEPVMLIIEHAGGPNSVLGFGKARREGGMLVLHTTEIEALRLCKAIRAVVGS